MKKLSAIIFASSVLFSGISFAKMSTEEREQRKAERKQEWEMKKGKVKEICKTDKEKCKQIKELRQKHKAEMEALINATK